MRKTTDNDGSGEVVVTRTLWKLHDTTREMIAADCREAVYEIATEAAVELLGFPYNTVREYDPEGDRLVPVAASTPLVDHDGDRRPYERGESVQWRSFETGEVEVFRDVTAVDDDADRTGEGCMVVVPLGDRGVLTLGSPEPRSVDPDDLELVRVFGANLETAVDRVDTLAALRNRERHLERKTERLNRFAGLIAHEFRNPVGIISGHLELVVGRQGDQRHLTAARDAVDRMNRLTESLLDLVRSDQLGGPVEDVAVAPLVRDVFDDICPATAVLDVRAQPTVAANPERLRTLFENVLHNAVEYGGREVTVTVGVLDDDGFYVADDGPGFETNSAEELFTYRASGGDDDVGLGLAIVRDVVAAHGWDVRATESRDGGSRLEFVVGADADADLARGEAPSL
ncbi:MAG: GAF domain-containing sensor histidine kinase [Halolamina sp.]